MAGKTAPATIELGRKAYNLHQGGPLKGGLSWKAISEKLGEPVSRLRHCTKVYRQTVDDTPTTIRGGEEKPGLYVTEEDNSLDAVYTERGQRPRVTTLEELIALAKIDLSTWRCENHWVNSYEVVVRDERKKLSMEDGRATGEIDQRGPIVVPVTQVKAKFIRIKPIAINPVVQPVQLSDQFTLAHKARLSRMPRGDHPFTRTMLLADPHFGFMRDGPTSIKSLHDPVALDLAVQLAAELQPDRIVILGDIFDLSDASDKFVQSPDYRYLLQPAIYAAIHFFAQLRQACPSAAIDAHEGNHDLRLTNAVIRHVPWAYQLSAVLVSPVIPALSIPGLLAFEQLDITWYDEYPKDHQWIDGNILLLHGDIARSGPGNTEKAMLAGNEYSVAFGHTHRKGLLFRNVAVPGGGRRFTFAYNPGCLCRVDGTVPGNHAHNWQQGVGFIDVSDKCPVQPIDIIITNGVAIHNGRRFVGEPVAPEEVRDWGG